MRRSAVVVFVTLKFWLINRESFLTNLLSDDTGHEESERKKHDEKQFAAAAGVHCKLRAGCSSDDPKMRAKAARLASMSTRYVAIHLVACIFK